MTLPTLLQEAPALQEAPGGEAVYDSLWAAGTPHPTSAFEQAMLTHDKLYVVLVVVLLIWTGIAFFLLRTDRKIDALERTLAEGIPEDHDDF